MTDPIDRVAASPPVQAVAPVPAPASAEQRAAEAPAREAEAPAANLMALDVRRGENGAFVYTLSDPATGRLVAVIPQGVKTQVSGDYEAGGWVDVSA